MPTSPRDLRGGNGWYKRTAQSSNQRDDEGIVPYAVGEFFPFIKPRFSLSGVPSTPAACGRHPLQAGESGGFPHPALRWGRGGTRSDPAPPHTRQGFALPPSPRRGFFSLIRPGRFGEKRIFTPYLLSSPGTGSGTARRNFPRIRSCPCPAGPFRPSSSGW